MKYVDGKYSFSFITYIYDHPWDGNDYAYIHRVNEVNGYKAYKILARELGVQNAPMESLLQQKFGDDADALFGFCVNNGIEYGFSLWQD